MEYVTKSVSLLDLPYDILCKIFQKIGLSDIRNVMLTCKYLRDLIAENNCYWRSLNIFVIKNSYGQKRQLLSQYNLCRVSCNWCNGVFYQKFHNLHTKYMPWLKFHNSKALYLSIGSELHCYPSDQFGVPDNFYSWKVEVPKVKRYDIRTNDISRFIIKDDLLVCGNRDGCAIVYKLNGITQKPQMLHYIQDCHDNGQLEVSAVELMHSAEQSIVVTASDRSPTLRYWYTRDHKNDDHSSGLRYHDTSQSIMLPASEGIRCLAFNEMQNKLAIGPNGNCKPLLLDVTMSKIFSNDQKPKNTVREAIRDIQWHNENSVVYVTHSGRLQFIDTRTCEVVYDSKDPFLVTLYCVKTDGDRAILAGSAVYARCVLFDRRVAGRHVQMYFTQKRSSPIYCLDFDSTKLIAAADSSLATLSFNVWGKKTVVRDYSQFHFT